MKEFRWGDYPSSHSQEVIESALEARSLTWDLVYFSTSFLDRVAGAIELGG